MKDPAYPLRSALVSILFFVAACSGPARDAVRRDIAAHPASGHYLPDVPFFPQNNHRCGPASLASVLNFLGASVTMDETAQAIYNERISGALPIDMLAAAKEAGFEAHWYNGGFGDLRRKIDEGAPLILFLNMGYNLYPSGHYIAVVGYDDNLKVVLAHSDMEEEAVFTYGELSKAWGKTGYSTLLVRQRASE
ncbi:MAG: C39 family peptidase [Deltaproteobacteria bacterium]|nr:C39 family peptidase [Deltaproteobacteria bacterium]